MSSISSIKLYINGDDYISIHTAVKKYSDFFNDEIVKFRRLLCFTRKSTKWDEDELHVLHI